MRDFLGKNEVTVENQEAIGQLKWSGLIRQQGYIQGIHMLTALGLLLLEAWIYLRIQKNKTHNYSSYNCQLNILSSRIC